MIKKLLVLCMYFALLNPLVGKENAGDEGLNPNKEEMRGQRSERSGKWRNNRAGGHSISKWLENMKNENPEEYERLSNLRQSNPTEFRQEMLKRHLERRRDKVRRDSKHEEETLELAEQFRKAETDEEKNDLREKLKEAVYNAFDANLRSSQERIERMEKELQKLREHLERRKAKKERICEARILDLTLDEELQWKPTWKPGRNKRKAK